jgi:hypothetical protein
MNNEVNYNSIERLDKNDIWEQSLEASHLYLERSRPNNK